MRQFIKSVTTISALSAIAFASAFISASPASAGEAQGLKGSYIGIGGGTVGDQGYASFNGRINIPNSQFSVRPTLLYVPDSGNGGFIGTLTYDAPIAKNTNFYLGAGGAFNDDFSSFALQTGVETAVSKNVVIYGDATYLTESGEVPWKVGVGYRF
jgi:hypothetical protein